MLILRSAIGLLSIVMNALGPNAVWGQDVYPNKPIRILANGPGGGSDIPARLIAPALSSTIGHQVIVENRSGIVPAETVSRASADGYTLLVAGSSFWTAPLLQKTPYDPIKDFSPITIINQSPNVLVIHPSVPAKTVKDLIALAKARPGALNYASGTTGSSAHLAPELFKAMAGVNIVRIPYKSGGAAVTGVLSGQVEMMFPNAGGMAPHIRSGRLRALAVASAKPSALLPDLPTVAASGVPGYESVSYIAFFAPAKTSDAIIKRLNDEMVRVLASADVKEKFFNAGTESVSSSPEQLGAAVRSEVTRLGKLIRDVGIKADE